jgi:hypothetical protein
MEGWFGEPYPGPPFQLTPPTLRRPAPRPPALTSGLTLRRPPFATIDGFGLNQWRLTTAQLQSVQRVAQLVVNSWRTTSPVTSLRGAAFVHSSETAPQLDANRARAVRDALVGAISSLDPSVLGRLRFEPDELRGVTGFAPRVEIFAWMGLTPPPATPMAPRIPTPADVARERQMGRAGFGEPPTTPRPAPCPPSTCTPVGSVLPSRHGFKFINSFSITIPLPRPFPSIPASFGLCGGMATAALDYFLSCISIPSTTTIPVAGNPLFKYLLARQLDSLGTPTFGMVSKFLSWTNLPDTRPSGALPILVPGAGLVPGLQELTVPEFRATAASVAAGHPVVLGLIYVGPGAVNIWHNHQVLAYGTAAVSPTVTNLRIYDPNDPRDDGVVIRCELLSGGSRVRCVELWPGGRSKTVRGFFRMPYARVTPPCLP